MAPGRMGRYIPRSYWCCHFIIPLCFINSTMVVGQWCILTGPLIMVSVALSPYACLWIVNNIAFYIMVFICVGQLLWFTDFSWMFTEICLLELKSLHVIFNIWNCQWKHICNWACKNQPCECKLHRVILLLISLALNVVFHFHKFQKKAH